MQFLAARLVGIVEVADALDAGDPGGHVAGIGVFLGIGRDVLALRALRVLFGFALDFLGQAGHLELSLDDLALARRLQVGRVGCFPGCLDAAIGTVAWSAARLGSVRSGAVRRSRSGAGRCPAIGFGTGLDSGSVGRLALSLSPPPVLLAWARKSALSGASPLADCTRITSSEGSDGAGLAMLKVMPRASTRVRDQGKEQGDAEAVGGTAGCDWRSRESGFDDVEKLAGDIKPELRIEFTQAGRRGDIDFGQPVADDVETDEQHAAAFQFGPDLGGDPAVPLADSGTPTPLPPAARLPRNSSPCGMRASAYGNRFAVDHQDALVARADFRE